MTLNVETDIDLNIKKVDELLEKLKQLEDKSKMITFITIKDFSKLRNISLKSAQDMFNIPDFPSENYGKQKVVELTALINWYQQKRDKNDSCQATKK